MHDRVVSDGVRSNTKHDQRHNPGGQLNIPLQARYALRTRDSTRETLSHFLIHRPELMQGLPNKGNSTWNTVAMECYEVRLRNPGALVLVLTSEHTVYNIIEVDLQIFGQRKTASMIFAQSLLLGLFASIGRCVVKNITDVCGYG
jgi:hypothetical protein